MRVKNAWYLNVLPEHVVVEKADGEKALFRQTPFRKITEEELTDYKGHKPNRCRGYQLNNYLYRFYGLEKCR